MKNARLLLLALWLAGCSEPPRTTGSIKGRVLDDAGKAIGGVTVSIKTPGSDIGVNLTRVTTADGVFRFTDVPPGRHMLAALNPGSQPTTARPDCKSCCEPKTNLQTSYYPKAASPDEATLISLEAGNDKTGVDIQLLRVPIYCVKGRVDYVIPKGDQLVLALRIWEPGALHASRVADIANENGRFLLTGLPRGKYMLLANHKRFDGGASEIGSVMFNVRDGNIESLVLKPESHRPGAGPIR